MTSQEILLVPHLHEASMDDDISSIEFEEEFGGDSELEENNDNNQLIDKEATTSTPNDCWGIFNSLCNENGKGRGRGRGHGNSILFALGGVLDPRATWVQEWNRIFLLVCVTGLFVDPLFFYALSINEAYLSIFVDGWFAIMVTAVRCMTDMLHLWNMWLQLKMAKYPPSGSRVGEKCASKVSHGYFKDKYGFFFDLFVILPFPQVRFLTCVIF